MLASHFHDEIVRQAVTSPLLIVAGLVAAVIGVIRLERRGGWLLLGVGVLAAATGTYRLVEVPALRHNHLCHAQPLRQVAESLGMLFGSLALIGLWVVAGWWVVAVHPWAGPALVTVTETNGVHAGDLPAIAVGVAATVFAWRRARSASCRTARGPIG